MWHACCAQHPTAKLHYYPITHHTGGVSRALSSRSTLTYTVCILASQPGSYSIILSHYATKGQPCTSTTHHARSQNYNACSHGGSPQTPHPCMKPPCTTNKPLSQPSTHLHVYVPHLIRGRVQVEGEYIAIVTPVQPPLKPTQYSTELRGFRALQSHMYRPHPSSSGHRTHAVWRRVLNT